MRLSILSPSIIPIGLSKSKNIGDAFIEDSIVNLLGDKVEDFRKITTRRPLNENEYSYINSSDYLIIAGANQLSTKYRPNFDIKKVKIPYVYFGIGQCGKYKTKKFISMVDYDSLKFFEESIKRGSWISVRDSWTRDILVNFFPQHQEKIILTGCPVLYGFAKDPGNNSRFGRKAKTEKRKVVFTFTDRDNIFKGELKYFDYVLKTYGRDNVVVALHQQNIGTETLIKKIKKKKCNYICSTNEEEYYSLYRESDLHVGSRLHAHIIMTSFGKESYLLKVDNRHVAFSETFKFPLNRFNLTEDDFDIYYNQVNEGWQRMSNFLTKQFNLCL